MAIDLRNDKGELDRSKVIAEIDKAFVYGAETDRDHLIDVMDDLHEAAWQDGYRKSVEDNA